MKKSFAVIGLGRFGSCVAKELAKTNEDVLAIDRNTDNVTKIAEFINNCAICDSTNKKDLQAVGMSSIDHVIVAIGNNLQSSILTTINLKSLGIKEITVRVDDAEYQEVFKTLGATNVIIPEEASAISLAHKIVSNSILDYYNVRGDHSIVQLKVKEDYDPKSLIELSVRQRFSISIIGIIRSNQFIMPQGTDKIMPKDILLVLGQNTKIRKFDSFINGD